MTELKLKIGKTYFTRRGRKVEIFQLDSTRILGGPYLGVVHFGNIREIFNFYENGRFLGDSDSMIDLIGEGEAPKEMLEALTA